ncbi:hypothetical protein LIER_06296 [Lithospermum erythrorhizon]|uniref:Transposase MuDR plant domain-containing protein n=1 Tax=Lithospermum erythrorhizon TaxID=34254 RepID=A0AAV3P5J0_LITER
MPCTVFEILADFRDLIRAYPVKTNKPLKFIKTDKWRLRVRCLVEGCNFSFFCSRIGKSHNLSIKTMVEEHMCGESIKNKNVSVKWLAKTYVNKIRREPRKTLKSFIGDAFDDYHIEITKSMAWKAIKAAVYLLFGNEKQQFVRLWRAIKS